MLFVGVGGVLLGLAGGVGGAAMRWRRQTDRLRADLEPSDGHLVAGPYDPDALEGLPAPVRRYFRAVLTPGQARVRGALFSQRGRFNLGEAEERWCPFTASQRVVTARPGFDWDARIALAPGLKVFVHDAYLAGEGRLHASVLGLFTVAAQRGTPEMAEGELMRFLAEAPWYPTVLLPGQGVRWEAIDENSALATLTDGETRVALVFGFDADGLIDSVQAPARQRMVNGKNIPHPLAWPLLELRRARRHAHSAARGSGLDPADGRMALLARSRDRYPP